MILMTLREELLPQGEDSTWCHEFNVGAGSKEIETVKEQGQGQCFKDTASVISIPVDRHINRDYCIKERDYVAVGECQSESRQGFHFDLLGTTLLK